MAGVVVWDIDENEGIASIILSRKGTLAPQGNGEKARELDTCFDQFVSAGEEGAQILNIPGSEPKGSDEGMGAICQIGEEERVPKITAPKSQMGDFSNPYWGGGSRNKKYWRMSRMGNKSRRTTQCSAMR